MRIGGGRERSGGAFRGVGALKAAITAVVAPSFIDDVDRLEREFDRCDTLYLLRDEHGDLQVLTVGRATQR